MHAIQTDKVYFLTMPSDELHEYDSIVHGLTLAENPDTVSWFDLISDHMYFGEVQELQQEKNSIQFRDQVTKIEYRLELLTKKLYDETVRNRLFPDGPDFESDQKIQEYFKSQHPYM